MLTLSTSFFKSWPFDFPNERSLKLRKRHKKWVQTRKTTWGFLVFSAISFRLDLYWVVVSKIFIIFIPIWGRFPFWHIFHIGWNPPTSLCLIHHVSVKTWTSRSFQKKMDTFPAKRKRVAWSFHPAKMKKTAYVFFSSCVKRCFLPTFC